MKTFNKRILGGHFVAWDLGFGASRLHSGPKCGRYIRGVKFEQLDSP